MEPTFRRIWRARGPIEVLLDGLAPERTPELHPLVDAIEALHADGEAWRYFIRERVPLGPWGIPNRYPVRWERTGPDTLRMEAWSRPSVYILHLLRFSPEPDGVTVDHAVQVDSPWWVRRFVRATAARAHEEWIRRVQVWVVAETLRRRGAGSSIAPCTEPYRAGTWLVRGTRAERSWEILATAEGPVFLRLPGAAPSGLDLAPRAAFGPGGLHGADFVALTSGPLEGWLGRGPAEAFAELPDWVVGALLRGPGASLVGGALVIEGSEPLQALAAL